MLPEEYYRLRVIVARLFLLDCSRWLQNAVECKIIGWGFGRKAISFPPQSAVWPWKRRPWMYDLAAIKEKSCWWVRTFYGLDPLCERLAAGTKVLDTLKWQFSPQLLYHYECFSASPFQLLQDLLLHMLCVWVLHMLKLHIEDTCTGIIQFEELKLDYIYLCCLDAAVKDLEAHYWSYYAELFDMLFLDGSTKCLHSASCML